MEKTIFELLNYVEVLDKLRSLLHLPPKSYQIFIRHTSQGRIQGGGAPGAPPPPPKIGKNMIFWRKIVIFHTKYPKIFRASLRSAQIF